MKRKSFLLAGFLTLAAYSQMAPGARQFMTSMTQSMSRMDKAMAAAPMSGDVDHDFAAMMIPHHEGAIEMAKAELQYGKDPVMRRLAQEIITDQLSEIQAMQLWISHQTNRQTTLTK